MNQNNIPESEAIQIGTGFKRKELTRRKVFFKGFRGRLRCFFSWFNHYRLKDKISLRDWLNQPIAYSIENELNKNSLIETDIIKNLEHHIAGEFNKEQGI